MNGDVKLSKYDFEFDVYEENTLSWIARKIEKKAMFWNLVLQMED